MAKEEIIFEFQVEQGAALTDLEKTKKSIIGLKEEQAELNKAYKQGNITLDEYSQESVRVEQTQKKLSRAYSDMTHELQGTKRWTDQLKGSMQQLAPQVTGAIDGFKGMAKAALAFIATPIGAVIAALGAALGAVIMYFRGTQEGQDKFNKLATVGTAIIGKLTDAIIALGKFIFDNLTKGFEAVGKALNYLIPGFEDLTKSVGKFLKLDIANSTTALEQQQRVLELQMITRRDQLKADIEAAKLRAAETKDAEVRQKALEEAKNKINELYDAEIKLATLQRDITKQRGDLAVNTFEDNKKIEESIARISQLERDRSSELQGIAKKETSIIESLKNERQKAFEEEQKRQEDLAMFLQSQDEKDIERQISKSEKELELYAESLIKKQEITDELADVQIEKEEEVTEESISLDELRALSSVKVGRIRMATLDAEAKLQQELIKKGMSAEQAQLKAHEIIQKQKLDLTADALGAAAGLFKKNTIAYKALSSAQALINAYVAASNALKDYPYPFGAIFAALAAAQGIATVAQINGVALAGGGSFETSGPTLMLVGDNPGGRERVEVTPLSGKGQTRILGNGGGIAMAGGGSLTAGGAVNSSMITRSSTSAIDTQIALNDVSSMPAPILDYSEFSQFINKITYKENLTEA